MKCLKCGYKKVNKVCPNCGEVYHYIKANKLKENKLKETAIILTLFITFGVLLSVGFVNLNNFSNRDYLNVNGLKVPTITSIVGKREVLNYLSKKNIQTICYSYDNFDESEIKKYIELLNFNDYIMYEKEEGIGLVKEENGGVTEINLTIEDNILKIDYINKIENINAYSLIGEIKIGNKEAGYLEVPARFVKKNHPDKEIYTSIKESITMEVIKNQTLVDFTKSQIKLYNSHNSNIEEEAILVHGNKGYLLKVEFKEGIYLTNYIFEKDGNLVSLSFETNNILSSINSIIYTYKVVK